MKVALQRVQAETQRILPDLPPDTRIDVEWMNPASFPILGYALTSASRSQADLRRLAEFTLKPELIRITASPGCRSRAAGSGSSRSPRPGPAGGRGLSAGDVVNAVRENNNRSCPPA